MYSPELERQTQLRKCIFQMSSSEFSPKFRYHSAEFLASFTASAFNWLVSVFLLLLRRLGSHLCEWSTCSWRGWLCWWGAGCCTFSTRPTQSCAEGTNAGTPLWVSVLMSVTVSTSRPEMQVVLWSDAGVSTPDLRYWQVHYKSSQRASPSVWGTKTLTHLICFFFFLSVINTGKGSLMALPAAACVTPPPSTWADVCHCCPTTR